jgi:glycosyltransferase involved in cell wall biosynthesis
VTVVYLAADPVFHAPLRDADRAAARERWELRRPYLFYIGGLEGRKNIPFLLRGFAAAGLTDVELVLAGGSEADRAALARLAGELGIGNRVRFPGFVPDADLPGLYAAALGFVYPSEYEGFGLQLVESMAVGCPTLASRATSLQEVLGHGGDTFALDDPGELAGRLNRLANDPAYRGELSERARRRSADFSWDRTAAETAAVYRRQIERRQANHGR